MLFSTNQVCLLREFRLFKYILAVLLRVYLPELCGCTFSAVYPPYCCRDLGSAAQHMPLCCTQMSTLFALGLSSRVQSPPSIYTFWAIFDL